MDDNDRFFKVLQTLLKHLKEQVLRYQCIGAYAPINVVSVQFCSTPSSCFNTRYHLNAPLENVLNL